MVSLDLVPLYPLIRIVRPSGLFPEEEVNKKIDDFAKKFDSMVGELEDEEDEEDEEKEEEGDRGN